MASLEFVVVEVCPEHAGAIVIKAGEVFWYFAWSVDGDDLACDGVFVFEPGVPDGFAIDLEMFGDGVAELEGGELLFLDEEEDVITFADGVVEGDFFDEEI